MYILGTDLVKECVQVCAMRVEMPLLLVLSIGTKYWKKYTIESIGKCLQAFFLCNKLFSWME
jgi:hypothetical protein